MARKSRLSNDTIADIITQFVANTPARSTALLCGASRKTATVRYHRFRTLIVQKLKEYALILDGEIEANESYFGGTRKGKREKESAKEER